MDCPGQIDEIFRITKNKLSTGNSCEYTDGSRRKFSDCRDYYTGRIWCQAEDGSENKGCITVSNHHLILSKIGGYTFYFENA